MAFIKKDRVREISTTTGTGAFTLAGAVLSYQAFSAVMATSDTCYYGIANQTASEWETGLGTYSGTNTLTRTTPIESSNGGAAVNFSAGTKDVFICPIASQTGLLAQAQTWTGQQTFIAPALGTPASGVATNLTGTASGLTAGAVQGNPNIRTPGFGSGVPGSGTVVSLGIVNSALTLKYSGTITGYSLSADQSGSIVVDIWKANAAIPTIANSITASAKPTLSSSQYISSTTLTGWTTTVTAGDVLIANVISAATVQAFNLELFITTN